MPMELQEVHVQALAPERLAPLIGPERMERFHKFAQAARDMLSGRVVANVNSAPTGGGVAEMLRTLLAYARGVGVNTRWFVINGDPDFLAITKRIHNHLYGALGDGGPLGKAEHMHYDDVLRSNAAELLTVVRPHDIVLLHNPQVAGLAADLARAGATVVWRCHVGSDTVNGHVEEAWAFLRPYLEDIDAYVFSRAEFAPPWADAEHVFVIPPSIDPFATKNQAMEPDEVDALLRYVGLLGGDGRAPSTEFIRADGSPGRVDRHADVLQTGPPRLLMRHSSCRYRRDRIKDMSGVMTAFAEHVDATGAAHLLLAGPVVTGVADDPEGNAVLEQCVEVWRRLPHADRSRVPSRVCLCAAPMRMPSSSTRSNATPLSSPRRALRRASGSRLPRRCGSRSRSWHQRSVASSTRSCPARTGCCSRTPAISTRSARPCGTCSTSRHTSTQLGKNARARAQAEFLGDRHLEQWAQLFAQLEANKRRSVAWAITRLSRSTSSPWTTWRSPVGKAPTSGS
jgi:trehalose synthase